MSQIIAICGRPGAGKSTIAKRLCGDPTYPSIAQYRTLEYVLSILYGWNYDDLVAGTQLAPDPIWHRTPAEATAALMSTLHRHFGSDYNLPELAEAPVPIKRNNRAVELSFAEPMKMIASVIFTFPGYVKPIIKMLYGWEEGYRKDRETIMCTPIKGVSMTARKCLEWLGTDVFRKSPEFGQDIWINIMSRNIRAYQLVAISDCRFDNEREALERLGAKFIVVCRDIADLSKQPMDESRHPSVWEFTTFRFKQANTLINSGSLDEFHAMIESWIAKNLS